MTHGLALRYISPIRESLFISSPLIITRTFFIAHHNAIPCEIGQKAEPDPLSVPTRFTGNLLGQGLFYVFSKKLQ